MRNLIDILLLVLSVVLIVLVLLQSGKTAGTSGALTGNGGLNLFAHMKERGSEKVLTIVTGILCVCYLALIISRHVWG